MAQNHFFLIGKIARTAHSLKIKTSVDMSIKFKEFYL